MLEIIILCGLFLGINALIKRFFVKRIGKSATAKHSVRLRKSYRFCRICLKTLFIIFMIAEIVYIFANMSEHYTYGILRMNIASIFIMLMALAYMSLPISGMTMDKFNENKPFALYLRGFATDMYEPSAIDNVMTAYKASKGLRYKKDELNMKNGIFSEQMFFHEIRRYLPAYSVGMTKELEAPEGTKRIYLDDDTWQEDVKRLIEHASKVFILVNPSDNCIWEIKTSLNCDPGKVVFIVNHPNSISELYNKMGDEFPSGLELGMKDVLVYNVNEYASDKIYFNNDKKGYSTAIKSLLSKEFKRHIFS